MDPINKNNTLYFESASAYPHDHRGVLWSTKEAQFIRFKILCEIAQDIYHSRVLDVGCGLGHLVDYLIERQFNGIYKGIDLVSKMIAIAQSRHPNFDFETNDIDSITMKSYDYVLASGIFSFVDWDYAQKMIEALFSRCAKGVAFNCLSLYAAQQERSTGLSYFNPTEVFAFCQQYTSKLVLRHDYLSNDFTMYLYK